jgi:hypothetical protein
LCALLWATPEGFAQYLVSQNEPALAVYSYQQSIYTAAPAERPALKLKLAKLYESLHQNDKAIALYNDLIDNAPVLEKQGRGGLAQLYLRLKEYDRAQYELTQYASMYDDAQAKHLSAWAALNAGDFVVAERQWTELSLTSNAYQVAAGELKQKPLAFQQLPQKNITGAQWLSAFLPGAGQVYAENWQDGLVSFLVNGLTISLLANAIQNNRTGEALIWGTLETAWYFGGIYSAGNSAQLYNKRVKTRFLEDMNETYGFEKF